MAFHVALVVAPEAGAQKSVAYATADGTATAGEDYEVASERLVFVRASTGRRCGCGRCATGRTRARRRCGCGGGRRDAPADHPRRLAGVRARPRREVDPGARAGLAPGRRRRRDRDPGSSLGSGSATRPGASASRARCAVSGRTRTPRTRSGARARRCASTPGPGAGSRSRWRRCGATRRAARSGCGAIILGSSLVASQE